MHSAGDDEPEPKRTKPDDDEDVGASSRRRENVQLSEEELRDQRFRAGDLFYGGEHPSGFNSAADLAAAAANRPETVAPAPTSFDCVIGRGAPSSPTTFASSEMQLMQRRS